MKTGLFFILGFALLDAPFCFASADEDSLFDDRGYPGQVLVDDGPGEVVTESGSCFVKVKGSFRCPAIAHRDDDILLNTGTVLGQLSFDGRDGETETLGRAIYKCACDSHANKHTAKWACKCPRPKVGVGSFVYQLNCKSSKTGELQSILSSPRPFSTGCP